MNFYRLTFLVIAIVIFIVQITAIIMKWKDQHGGCTPGVKPEYNDKIRKIIAIEVVFVFLIVLIMGKIFLDNIFEFLVFLFTLTVCAYQGIGYMKELKCAPDTLLDQIQWWSFASVCASFIIVIVYLAFSKFAPIKEIFMTETERRNKDRMMVVKMSDDDD